MHRSLNCALASFLLLTGVGLVPAAYASGDDAEPISSPQSTNPGGGGGTANYTYADIVCTTDQVHVVKFKAWGNQYPGATSLDVEQEIDISGHSGFWEKIERWPTT